MKFWSKRVIFKKWWISNGTAMNALRKKMKPLNYYLKVLKIMHLLLKSRMQLKYSKKKGNNGFWKKTLIDLSMNSNLVAFIII